MSNGKYIRALMDDYCVIDTETTGLSAYYDEIIEIGIIRVRDKEIVGRYSQLIKPQYEIDEFITALTGITNDMVSGMPSIDEVKNEVLGFIGEDILVGHNTSFDIRFLNAGFGEELDNKYLDTMQFARKVYPELEHHRLSDLTEFLHISSNEHRAMSDCISTYELYEVIKRQMAEKGLSIDNLWKANRGGRSTGIDINSIVPTNIEINEDSFFFGKHIVFTGKLEIMVRRDAMQVVVNLGGLLDNSVTKKTNFLILGNNDYNAILHGEKSSKHKKAEQLRLDGNDIEIIDEYTFYDILLEEGI